MIKPPIDIESERWKRRAQPKEVRHFVPAPGMAVCSTEYNVRSAGGVWYPDQSIEPLAHGNVLGIGALKGHDIPLQQSDHVTYAPYSPKEFDLGDGVFTMISVRDIFTIQGSAQRVPILYDYRLAPGSIAGDTLAWLIKGHVLIRTYSPRGFTESGIWVERNEKHPKVWAWILAIRYDDHARLGLYPGDFVNFIRHSDETLGYDPTLRTKDREKLPIAITHLDNVLGTAEGDDVPKAEF